MTDLPIMVATAFVLGVAARFVRLPPLVGLSDSTSAPNLSDTIVWRLL